MSDGHPFAFHDIPTGDASRAGDGAPPAFADPRRVGDARKTAPLLLQRLAQWLPRLGTVLWIERREAASPTHARGVGGDGLILLEHPAASALARCASLRVCASVTAQGPREWLALADARHDVAARLYLLPDTDCLAWDEMIHANAWACVDTGPADPPVHETFLRRALARFGQRWQARLLQFDQRQQPWLQVLGARAPLRISLLGLDLARTIVRDEHAEWISPLHMD